jgi:hypothetical protein
MSDKSESDINFFENLVTVGTFFAREQASPGGLLLYLNLDAALKNNF